MRAWLAVRCANRFLASAASDPLALENALDALRAPADGTYERRRPSVSSRAADSCCANGDRSRRIGPFQ